MEPLRVVPTRVKIADILRKIILSGEFAPGTELTLTGMAARLGVSRTPVREAFQTLESEGLLELRMNRGATVKTIDETFILDHFGLRMLLESEAAFRAVKNHMNPTSIRTLQNEINSIPPSRQPDVYDQYNLNLHELFWQASGSRKLANMLATFWQGPSFNKEVEDAEHRRLGIAEHEAIVVCVENGDADGCRQAMQRHIERCMQYILDTFRREKGDSCKKPIMQPPTTDMAV